MTTPADDRPAPTLTDIEQAHEARRAAAQHQDQRAALGSRAARRLVERQARWFGLGGVILSVLSSLVFGWWFMSLQDRLEVGEVLAAQQRAENSAAIDSLRRTNSVLTARGQPPVAEPASDDPQEAVTAAVTARVLAQLPPGPTAGQVAAVIGPAALAQITGPTADQLAAQVAAYFAINATSLRGAAGPGPTAEQIQAAVDAAYAANPPPPGRDGTNGEDGAPGPPGVSLASQQFVRDGAGACVSRTSYSDGRVETFPAGDAACPPPEPAPEPTEPPPSSSTGKGPP